MGESRPRKLGDLVAMLRARTYIYRNNLHKIDMLPPPPPAFERAIDEDKQSIAVFGKSYLLFMKHARQIPNASLFEIVSNPCLWPVNL